MRPPLPEVIIPLFGLSVPPSRRSGIVLSGLFRLKWLNASRKSPRNCSRQCSLKAKDFVALMSQFHRPGPNSMLRAEFPQVHLGGGAKAAGLSHETPLLLS